MHLDYYKILGVDRGASVGEVESAYKASLQKDLDIEGQLEAAMACKVLTTEELRREYEDYLGEQRKVAEFKPTIVKSDSCNVGQVTKPAPSVLTGVVTYFIVGFMATTVFMVVALIL